MKRKQGFAEESRVLYLAVTVNFRYNDTRCNDNSQCNDTFNVDPLCPYSVISTSIDIKRQFSIKR